MRIRLYTPPSCPTSQRLIEVPGGGAKKEKAIFLSMSASLFIIHFHCRISITSVYVGTEVAKTLLKTFWQTWLRKHNLPIFLPQHLPLYRPIAKANTRGQERFTVDDSREKYQHSPYETYNDYFISFMVCLHSHGFRRMKLSK